jgi:surfactin synthase thioesterase subunit
MRPPSKSCSGVANWLRFFPQRRAEAKAVLVCFPPAGSSAGAFAAWPEALPTWLDLCAVALPGREARITEPAPRSIAEVAEQVAAEVAALDRPVALLGHSLGSWIAFETAMRLRVTATPVLWFFAAAARPPQLGDRLAIDQDDASLIAYLRELGGTAEELLLHAEMRDLILPALRADLALAACHPARSEILAVPAAILCGAEDHGLPIEFAGRWRELIAGPCEFLRFRGGHFFVQTARDDVVACVIRRIRNALVR